MSVIKIEDVLNKYRDGIMSIPGVVGIGQGFFDGKSCIKVYIVKKTSYYDDKIPKSIEGYSVEIKETGVIRAYPEKGK